MERAKNTTPPRKGLRGILFSGVVALGVTGLVLGIGPGSSQGKEKPNRYIGADKCKSCHNSEETGDQYGIWQHMNHAKAYATLASAEAKEAAQARGIDDPQTADACLKCHVTAFGLPEEAIKKGFDPKLGIQCESCHGPGENHVKARMTAVAKGETDVVVPAGEMITVPPAETCRGCHNAESPTYTPFCYYQRVEKILHLNPKKRSAEELAKRLVCGCGEACSCDEECEETCPIPQGERK